MSRLEGEIQQGEKAMEDLTAQLKNLEEQAAAVMTECQQAEVSGVTGPLHAGTCSL